MPVIRALALAAILAISTSAPVNAATAPGAGDHLKWMDWSSDLFAKAKAEHRLVVLDLEAEWCHWCHVMEQETYSNPAVRGLIDEKYIPVRVDQDANPDLSSRYGDWGWPATIVFAPDGTELVKLRGYIEPDRMAKLLRAVIDDPTPGPSAQAATAVTPAKDAFLPKAQRDDLKAAFEETYDKVHGGWGGRLRYIDADSMDYDLALAERGDRTADAEARRTFDAARALVDPVWGGVSQYSDDGTWGSPHFEKIMSFQAQYLRQYSEAYARWHDAKDRTTAAAIAGYLMHFLRGPEGAFYVSQDADLDATTSGHVYYALDDAGRRKLGLPRIDRHLYARENGWAIVGLAAYADATNDDGARDAAVAAAHWVVAHRALPGGGYRHDAIDRGGPFLGDTLAMGQAFVALYATTGDRAWLDKAMAAANFIDANFRDPDGGFFPNKASEAKSGTFAKPVKQLDDQVAVARFANLLARYTGKSTFSAAAKHAMRYAVGAGVDADRPVPGLLLADLELGREPAHVTIIGHKDDVVARNLDVAARALPFGYKRLDWWDTREGPLVNPDITYPELDRAAAFACGNRTCSLPLFSVDELDEAVARMARFDNRAADLEKRETR